MTTPACAPSAGADPLPSVSGVRDDEGRRRGRLGALLTATGLLATALVTTYVIKTGVSAGIDSPVTEQSPRTVVATVGPSIQAATPQAVTVTADPAAMLERPVLLPAPVAAPQPVVDLREIVYTVAGNQRPNDPVTVVYADETGTLQTLQDVTLPWTLTVKPDVPVNYVYAKSRGSLLNCWITDAGGSTVAAGAGYGPTTSCNR